MERMERKDLAVNLGKSWVDEIMKRYSEPVRTGVRKGDLIGFSGTKKRASLLMVLHSRYGLGLKQIAQIAKLKSVGVLQVWRTEKAFKEAEREACDLFWNMILNSLEPSRGSKSLRLQIKGEDPELLIELLSFFNPLIVNAFIKYAIERLQNGDFRYLFFGLILDRSMHMAGGKSLKHWLSDPTILTFMKACVAVGIDLLFDEKSRRLGKDQIKIHAETLKAFILRAFDGLARK